MKKIFNKNTVFGIVLGGIIFGSVVYGINSYQSNEVEYNSTDSSWNVSNVNEAINSLYSNVKELDNIKSIGDAEASDIASGKTALVQGELITGTATAKDRNWKLVVQFTTYLTRNGYSTSSPSGTRIYTLTIEHINGVNTLKTSFSGWPHINGTLSGTPAAFCEGFKIISFSYLD